MTKPKNIKTPYHTPPLDTILAAMREDPQAMDELTRFYRPYIRTLATRDLYDAAGITHPVVDEQLCRELEIRHYVSFEIPDSLTKTLWGCANGAPAHSPTLSIRSKRLQGKRFDRLKS